MSISDYILIEKYFRQELTAEEKKLFEKRKSTDPSFLEEVAIHEQALRIIQQEGHQMLKQRFAAIGKSTDRNNKIVKWMVLLLTVASIILVFTLTTNIKPIKSDEKKETIIPGAYKNTPYPTNPDSLSPERMGRADGSNKDTPSSHSPTSVTIDKQNTESLFAENFSPYADESLQSGLRGHSSLSPADQFIEAYLKGNHTEALSFYEKMDVYDRQNDNMIFIKSNSLLAKGKFGEAIDLLEGVVDRDATRFMDAAKWYLALAYLKTGEVKKGKIFLEKLRNSEENSYFQKATVLIQKL